MIKKLIVSHYEVALLAVISLVAGVFFLLSTPLGFGNDEMVHAYKGIALSKGQVFSTKVGEPQKQGEIEYSLYGGMAPQSLSDLAALTAQSRAIATCTNSACAKTPEDIVQKIDEAGDRPINEPINMINFWGANNYIFVPYVPAAVGFSIAQILDTSTATALHLARVSNLIIGIALACFAFLILKHSRFRWVVFAVALLPSTILSFGLLGVDGLLNGLSLVLLAIVARGLLKKNGDKKWLTYTAITVAILLPLIKIPYVLLSLLVFIPGVLTIGAKHKILKYCTLAVCIILPAIAWNIAVSDISKTSSIIVNSGSSAPNTTEQIQQIVQNPLGFTETLLRTTSTYGTLPSVDNLTHQKGLKMPIDLTVLSLVPLLLATLYASREFKLTKRLRRSALIIIATSLALIGGIFLAMYLTFNSVGSSIIEGVQGRYFIPVYGFVALGLSILTSISIPTVKKSHKIAFILLAALIPLSTAIWYIGIVY